MANMRFTTVLSFQALIHCSQSSEDRKQQFCMLLIKGIKRTVVKRMLASAKYHVESQIHQPSIPEKKLLFNKKYI